MNPEDRDGAEAPETQGAPESGEPAETTTDASPEESSSARQNPGVDDPYGYYDDPYAYDASAGITEQAGSPAPPPAATVTAPPPTPPPPSEPEEEEDADDDGMLRMSFLDHLEELRKRLILMLAGMGVAFVATLYFAPDLWNLVSQPAVAALREIGAQEKLIFTSPTEAFTTMWVKVPMLTAIFLASPWILYQVWAFIAPGLYRRERRWAVPFVLCSAGLFILGGLFAYFVAFRFGLTFLLGIGRSGGNVEPYVSITQYFDLFVNVMLGVAIVFELPVLIFFLTLLRVTTPRFLLVNSRYAILGIVILAAIITPTPDVVNLVIFAVPMVLLYFVGVFASYLLVLHREDRRFPWGVVFTIIGVLVVAIVAGVYFAVTRYGYSLVPHWPFLLR